jgi:protein involved in polysaccharide export with SLBB domain
MTMLRSGAPLFLLCLLALMAAPGTLQGQTVPAAGNPGTPLRIGDAVRITVWQSPEMSGEFLIGPEGTVLHPLYRSIRIAGLPLAQAESEVRRVLLRFETSPEFVIEPLYNVTISGSVRSPNVYMLPPQTSLPQAIAQAGGPAPDARLDRARLLRGGSVIPVDLTRPVLELENIRVQSGDQIVLDRRRRFMQDSVLPVLTPIGSVASIVYTVLRLTRGR